MPGEENSLVNDDPPIHPYHLATVIPRLRAGDVSSPRPRFPRHKTGNRPGRCRAATAATASELAALTALPRPVEPVVRRLTCELAAGHHGRHVAFAVAADDGERWVWVRWSPWSRGHVDIDPCPNESADPALGDCCLLPHAHTGPHSFEID